MENEANQRTACYLGLNPYAPETWPVETVNRLSRIHAEQGEEAFRREIDNLMTPPAGIHSPQNACCYRNKCREAAAALTAAEARIKALEEVFNRWSNGHAFDDDSDEDVALYERAQALSTLGGNADDR